MLQISLQCVHVQCVVLLTRILRQYPNFLFPLISVKTKEYLSLNKKETLSITLQTVNVWDGPA